MIILKKDERKYLPTIDEIDIGEFFIVPSLPDKILIKMDDINDMGYIPCEFLENRGLGQTISFNPYLNYAPTVRVQRVEISEIRYKEYSSEGEED